MAKQQQVKIKLVKSMIGRNPRHVQIVKQLGLRKMHHSVIQPDNAAIRGMIAKVYYMLLVEEVAS